MLKKEELSIFSLAYWREAAAQFLNLRMLCVAAMFIALRVILKLFTIVITPTLQIEIDFLVDALGSAIYGPLVGLACGAVTDTISAICFPPVGGYCFPFIFQEMLGSFLFALFLWRRNLTVNKILVAKGFDTIFCNMILNSLLLKWLYGKGGVLFILMRLLKNVSFYPVECFCLVVLFSAILPPLMHLPIGKKIRAVNLKMTKRHYLVLGIMLAITIVVMGLFFRFGLPLYTPKNETPTEVTATDVMTPTDVTPTTITTK